MKRSLALCIALSLVGYPLWAQQEDGPSKAPKREEPAGEARSGDDDGDQGKREEEQPRTAEKKRRPEFKPSEEIQADSVISLPADI